MTTATLIQVGKKLKKARQKRSLTQQQVADKVGIHVSYYYRIERGVVNPSIEILEQVCKVLKIKGSEILPF
ncbi:helix-turn-helix transcriptional regulator [Candidatus Beckwithbacteria bacterium]|nr:helix-turn-helix transcriptional regulator [Candidatus Beckwithbacteria bacterium]